MNTCCFYISDYGYGHAARAIALIREMVDSFPDVRVIAKTAGPFAFTKNSLVHPRVSVIYCKNDINIPLKEGRAVVDRAKAQELFRAWVQSWDEYVSCERAFCRDHDVCLILSDIAPQPFLVADALGIPGIAISNFSWDTIYAHLFSETDAEAVNLLRAAYQKSSQACVLPFDIGMDIFLQRKRVGLVSRKITVSRPEMRLRCGIRDGEFLVYLGKAPDARCPPVHAIDSPPDIRFLVPSGVFCPGAVTIPPAETESQNWIGMCDCAVTKCGYSTVSEAARAKVPLLVWKRHGFIEDVAIARQVEDLGIGRMVSGIVEGVECCVNDRLSIEKYKERFDTLDRQYTTNGIPEIMRVIKRMIA